MPTPKDVAKKIKRQAQIRTIKLGEIRVSPSAQRDLNPAKAKRILDRLTMEDLGTFTVSYRDGFYWLVDGQHRMWALREYFGEGYEDWEVEAWCYFDLTEAEEAEKFLTFNDSLAVDAYAKFKVGVTAGRPVENDVDRIVRSLGLKVARAQAKGSIAAVASLIKTYTRFGPQGLVQTLWTIREAFGDGGYEAKVIDGMALFRARYEGRIDAERLVKKLSSTQNGVKGILQRAALKREQTNQAVATCIAAAITDVYNSGLRGIASLGSWWKEGRAAA